MLFDRKKAACMTDKKIEAHWSGYDKNEAIHVLNTQHPEKMMLRMNDGLFVIITPEDFIKAAKI